MKVQVLRTFKNLNFNLTHMLQYLQGTDNLSDFRLRIEVRFSKFYKKNTEHPNQNPKKGAFFSDFEKNNS